MSSISISNGNNTVSGRLVLTNYGIRRVLERIANNDSFIPLSLIQIGIGDKMSTSYSSNTAYLRNEVAIFDVDPDNITVEGNICTISTDLSLSGGLAMQELGLYEIIGSHRYLFAYASGFSMITNENLSYNLLIKLALYIAFNDEHYSNYEVNIGNTNYAKQPDVTNLYNNLMNVQLDLERSIQSNAKEIGYNFQRAKSFNGTSSVHLNV